MRNAMFGEMVMWSKTSRPYYPNTHEDTFTREPFAWYSDIYGVPVLGRWIPRASQTKPPLLSHAPRYLADFFRLVQTIA